MSKSWANPTWFFFHTLIEKIHPDHYLKIKDEVMMHIKKPLFAYDGLIMYQRVNLLVCYKLFREQFIKKTNNPRMFLDSMSRSNYIKDLDLWLQKNKLF